MHMTVRPIAKDCAHAHPLHGSFLKLRDTCKGDLDDCQQRLKLPASLPSRQTQTHARNELTNICLAVPKEGGPSRRMLRLSRRGRTIAEDVPSLKEIYRRAKQFASFDPAKELHTRQTHVRVFCFCKACAVQYGIKDVGVLCSCHWSA